MATHSGLVLLARALVDVGFRKRVGQVFTAELAGGQLGWVGVNVASRSGVPGQVVLNPVVGLRDQGIERIVAEGRGEKFHPYLPPTVSSPLRYLQPTAMRAEWILKSSPDDAAVVAAVVAAIENVGWAFFDQHRDLGRLVTALEGARAGDIQAAYRWPVAMARQGSWAAARTAAEVVETELDGREDIAAAELKAFLGWFRRVRPGQDSL